MSNDVTVIEFQNKVATGNKSTATNLLLSILISGFLWPGILHACYYNSNAQHLNKQVSVGHAKLKAN